MIKTDTYPIKCHQEATPAGAAISESKLGGCLQTSRLVKSHPEMLREKVPSKKELSSERKISADAGKSSLSGCRETSQWMHDHIEVIQPKKPAKSPFTCETQELSAIEKELAADPDVKQICDAFSKEFGFKVSPFQVMCLIFACLKVIIESRQLEKKFRREEREELIRQMEKVCEHYLSMAKDKRLTAILTGVMYLVSGAAPIVGFMKGKFLIDKLSSVFDSLKGMDKNKFSSAIMKMAEGMAKTTEQTGMIKETFERSHQHRAESLQRRASTLEEECTQSSQGYMRDYQDMIDFIMRYLQMENDTTGRILSH